MNHCSQCGIRIPEGQKFCSVCYGDIDYGRDGHYRAMVEAEELGKEAAERALREAQEAQ